MKSIDNEIVIIGGDHHNTLAIIRCFGMYKVPFKVIIHGEKCDKNDIAILHSKYVKYYSIVDNDIDSIVNELIKDNSENIQYIIPCSDLAEYAIDVNYDKLSNKYIMPGFYKNPGLVVKMMDKYEQKKWADKNGILMAKSWLIIKKNGLFKFPDNLKYPCIIKPNVSAFGKKSDIRIINNKQELIDESENYNKSDYKELMLQEKIMMATILGFQLTQKDLLTGF